jgi:hypothetical protein
MNMARPLAAPAPDLPPAIIVVSARALMWRTLPQRDFLANPTQSRDAERLAHQVAGMDAREKEAFRIEQRAWLRYRDSCQKEVVEACLLERMKLRWNEVMEKWVKQAGR